MCDTWPVCLITGSDCPHILQFFHSSQGCHIYFASCLRGAFTEEAYMRWSWIITCHLVDFTVPVNPQRENERKRKDWQILGAYQRTKKKLWNMKVIAIPIVVDVLGTIPKGVEKRLKKLKIRGRIETTHTSALLRSARTLRRVLETRGVLLTLKI